MIAVLAAFGVAVVAALVAVARELRLLRQRATPVPEAPREEALVSEARPVGTARSRLRARARRR